MRSKWMAIGIVGSMLNCLGASLLHLSAWWIMPLALGSIAIGLVSGQCDIYAAKERARKRTSEELAEAIRNNPQAREDWVEFFRDCQTRRNAPRN